MEIETVQLFHARRPDIALIKKENKKEKKESKRKQNTCRMVDFAVCADLQVKINKTKRKTSNWTLQKKKTQKTKKAVEHKDDGESNRNW